jgi:hypothetical protein
MPHEPTYGDACATARTEIRSELARLWLANDDRFEAVVEAFVATLHIVPPWALRKILERREGK